MGLLDVGTEDPNARKRRYILTIVVATVLLLLALWWFIFGFLHLPERRAAAHFFDTITSGNFQSAYQQTKADPAHYTFKDFTDDWGPTGYYGPVKSYQIESASSPAKSGSGIIVTVDVSPYTPFPSDNEVEKSSHTKEIKMWVESKDKSISISPF
jgi:hypothetical protein